MGKGIAALEYLPQIDLVLEDANVAASTEAFRGLANLIAKLQSEETADGTYTGLIARGNNPYDSSTWDIVVSGTSTAYACTLVSEVKSEDLGGKGRAALSTRRAVDLTKATGPVVSMRSFLALVNFVESVEDKVAQTGSGSEGDATYTAVPLKGNTPFKTYEWTVVKLGDLYTLTSTANSN
jgi:hypothetical protein